MENADCFSRQVLRKFVVCTSKQNIFFVKTVPTDIENNRSINLLKSEAIFFLLTYGSKFDLTSLDQNQTESFPRSLFPFPK